MGVTGDTLMGVTGDIRRRTTLKESCAKGAFEGEQLRRLHARQKSRACDDFPSFFDAISRSGKNSMEKTAVRTAISTYSDYIAHQRGWKHTQKQCRCIQPAKVTCRKCGDYCQHCGGLIGGKANAKAC